MRTSLFISIACAGAAAVAGCNSSKSMEEKDSMSPMVMDRWTVTSITDTAINNGIIAQHTLYPYHFVLGTAELNELGQRELNVLAEHYKTNAGPLSVRKGDGSNDLYQARLKTVNDALAAAGVKPEHVMIADRAPGGPGMSSEEIVSVTRDKDAAGRAYNPESGGVNLGGTAAGAAASSGLK